MNVVKFRAYADYVIGKVNLEFCTSGKANIGQYQDPGDAHSVVTRPGVQEGHHESRWSAGIVLRGK